MAIATYSDLKTAVINWAIRDGDPEFQARVPDFIQFAEKRLGEQLRVAEQEQIATLTLVNGAADLPVGALGLRRVLANSSPTRVLDQISPEQADEFYASPASGYPYWYTIVGRTLKVYPTTTATVSVTYYAAIPPLSDAAPTNWLLERAPQLYLYAALLEAAPYIEDDGKMQVWGVMFDRALTQFQSSDVISRFGAMQSRPRFPTP